MADSVSALEPASDWPRLIRLGPTNVAWCQHMKPRRTWTPPAPPPPGRTAAASPSQAPIDDSIKLPSPPGTFSEYVGRTFCYLIFYGLLAGFFQSRFPLALGLFLFVANERFIEWALAKVGIRFVSDSMGLAFIDSFLFFAGAWLLIAAWKDSAPAWLLPLAGGPWLAIVIMAFACAVLKTLSGMAARKLLPRFGIALTPWRQSTAELGLMGLALIICVAIVQWL